jgi:DNA primase
MTHEYRVEGPVMIMLTTTAVELDEELVNRALVLTVDEDREQTRAIHERQRARRTLEGRLASVAKAELLALHRNAQRLIEPITVVNPYAPQLTFLDARTRARRDHEKYLTLIDVVALLHQHQRERKTITRGAQALTYLEVTREDIAVANRLAAQVLGRSLDELPPQTRRFLTQREAWVAHECATHRGPRNHFRFHAREARDAIGLGPTQVKLHLHRLVELEYVLVHRAPRGHGVSYELVYTAADHSADTTIFSGLREADALTNARYDDQRSDLDAERSGVGRPSVGGRPGGGRRVRTARASCARTVSYRRPGRSRPISRDRTRIASSVVPSSQPSRDERAHVADHDLSRGGRSAGLRGEHAREPAPPSLPIRRLV